MNWILSSVKKNPVVLSFEVNLVNRKTRLQTEVNLRNKLIENVLGRMLLLFWDEILQYSSSCLWTTGLWQFCLSRDYRCISSLWAKLCNRLMFSFPYCCLLLFPIPLCWWFSWSIIPYNQPLFSTDTMLFPAPDIRSWALYSVFPSDTNGPRARLSLAVLSTALSYGLLLVGLLTVFEDMAFLWNFRSVLLLLPQWAMSLVLTNLGFPSEIKRSCTWPCLALIVSGILFFLFWFIRLDISCLARISNSLTHMYILYPWRKLLKGREYLQVLLCPAFYFSPSHVPSISWFYVHNKIGTKIFLYE